ncbi:hypothetical protein C8R43DRAFT_948483 [Mycena crocata]|nr:hypothetical protein C8R43DRAFT_948483 [Mycena crocata]
MSNSKQQPASKAFKDILWDPTIHQQALLTVDLAHTATGLSPLTIATPPLAVPGMQTASLARHLVEHTRAYSYLLFALQPGRQIFLMRPPPPTAVKGKIKGKVVGKGFRGGCRHAAMHHLRLSWAVPSDLSDPIISDEQPHADSSGPGPL